MPAEMVVSSGIFGGVTLRSPKSAALGAVTAKTPTGCRDSSGKLGKGSQIGGQGDGAAAL